MWAENNFRESGKEGRSTKDGPRRRSLGIKITYMVAQHQAFAICS